MSDEEKTIEKKLATLNTEYQNAIESLFSKDLEEDELQQSIETYFEVLGGELVELINIQSNNQKFFEELKKHLLAEQYFNQKLRSMDACEKVHECLRLACDIWLYRNKMKDIARQSEEPKSP